MRKQILAMAAMLLFVFGLMWGGHSCMALAAANTAEGSLSGNVGMLKQENSRYIMQVTVENSGEDFTGTVQVIFGSDYDNCAYNTEITLPAQGKKQFTIAVPENAAETVYGICQLNFLDERGETIQSISLKDVYNGLQSGITAGILSDDYSSLTFMDAGGEPLYVRGIDYPMELVELNNDNLLGYLDGLYFLVIDQFNVSSLSEDNIQAIQDWVTGGGWLIVGTGTYAEQTLTGFDEAFLNVGVTGISQPGEENIATVNEDKYGYYYNYTYDAGIDFTQMAIADLDYNKMHMYGAAESVDNPSIIYPVGDGAVSILYFSLAEKELQKMSFSMVQRIFEEVMYQSDSYQNFGKYRDLEYVGQRALAFIDSRNSDVDFSWLKVLIFIYVIVVGPILYLILRKCKRSEWYWVGAPALGILFIAGVYFFGRGIRITEAKVYSVTVQQTESSQADTYFLAYHSGVKPWKVYLNDRYDVAGPGFQGYSYYSRGNASITDYHYVVGNDSKGMSVGMKPRGNFENGFFYAGAKAESKGTISGTDFTGFGVGNMDGSVTNGTAYDMAYLAVYANSYIMVISDVKAGETVSLTQAAMDGRCIYEGSEPYFDSLLHNMVGVYRSHRDYEQADMAALLIGIGVAEERKPNPGTAVLAGVVRDYDKAVADKCKETAYGCFYSYGQTSTGGGQNASN